MSVENSNFSTVFKDFQAAQDAEKNSCCNFGYKSFLSFEAKQGGGGTWKVETLNIFARFGRACGWYETTQDKHVITAMNDNDIKISDEQIKGIFSKEIYDKFAKPLASSSPSKESTKPNFLLPGQQAGVPKKAEENKGERKHEGEQKLRGDLDKPIKPQSLSKEPTESSSLLPKSKENTEKNNTEVEQKLRGDLGKSQTSPTAEKLLKAYDTDKEGWVMVPPKDLINVEKPFVIGSGAAGYEGNGRWKIHVSIDPRQMEQAIPILVEVLHSQDAPRLGFKMQTKANLNSVHQIGKELAIIFDKNVEKEAMNNPKIVEDFLSLLWNKLHAAGIHPEPGLVLTPKTMAAIEKASDNSQIKEKQNLERGKFDRAISCPEGSNYFYYRDENFAPMEDNEIGDLRGIPGVFCKSEILALAKQNPDLAHNPTQSADPFLKLQIKADVGKK